MKQLLQIFVVLLMAFTASAQVQDSVIQEASPRSGINKLALRYYGIDFNKEQRTYLNDKQVELIYHVTADGAATLEDINGIDNQIIRDSLYAASKNMPPFNPRVLQGGKKVESIYFLQLEYPKIVTKQRVNRYISGITFATASIDDFEYIEKSNARFDIGMGALVNNFFASFGEHLALGGGMSMDMLYTNSKGYRYGGNMSLYGNSLKKTYALATNRTQLKAPPTVLMGISVGKWFGNVSVRADINYAVQNITGRRDQSDPDWVQFGGWSPGIVVDYPLQIGRDRPSFYFEPILEAHYINFRLGIRYIHLSHNEARGIMGEVGIGYNLGAHGLKSYKLKE